MIDFIRNYRLHHTDNLITAFITAVKLHRLPPDDGTGDLLNGCIRNDLKLHRLPPDDGPGDLLNGCIRNDLKLHRLPLDDGPGGDGAGLAVALDPLAVRLHVAW